MHPGCSRSATCRGHGRRTAEPPPDREERVRTDTIDAITADRALKARHRAIWALGDYPAVATQLMPELGRVLVAAAEVRRGDRACLERHTRAWARSRPAVARVVRGQVHAARRMKARSSTSSPMERP